MTLRTNYQSIYNYEDFRSAKVSLFVLYILIDQNPSFTFSKNSRLTN